MLSKATQYFASNIGLKLSENSAFGIYGNYFVTVSDIKSKKKIEFSCFVGTEDDMQDTYMNLTDSLRDAVETYGITDYTVEAHSVSVTTSAPLTTVHELLDFLVSILKENGVLGTDYCSECGEKTENSKPKIVTVTVGSKSVKHYLCSDCALEMSDEENESDTNISADKPKHKKGLIFSVISGLLFSALYVVLFALIGVNAFSSGSVGYLCTLFAFFIGGAVACIYNKFAGGIDFFGIVSISITTFACTALAHFFGCVIGLFGYMNTKLSIGLGGFFNNFGNFVSLQFSSSLGTRFFALGTLVGLCAGFIAVIIIYSISVKKNSEYSSRKITIQTVK